MRGNLLFRDIYIPKLRWRSLSLFFLIFMLWQPSNAQVLNESFDDSSIPTGWTQSYVSGGTNWVTVTTNGNSTITPHTGNRMAEFRVGSYGPTTKLVTPSLDLTGLTNPLLTFYYANVNWAGDIDELRVYYKTSASGEWVQIGDDYTDEKTSWAKVELVLPNPSADYYIAFEATSNWARGLDLDDVSIEEAPSCIAPTSLSASNITAGNADLSWTSDGTLFDIEWGAAGFTPGTGTMVNDISDNPYNLTGLSSNTAYQFYVRTDCGGGDVSGWGGPYTFNTPPACGDNFYDSGGNSSNYGNNENYSITIYPDIPGNLVSVSFSSFNTEQGWDGLMIYDGDSDSSPLISSGSTYGRTTCPNGAWNGTGTYSANGMTFTSTHSSGALTFVFTSDSGTNYSGWEASISCAPPPSCIAPTDLSHTQLGLTSAELGWTSGGTAFELKWGEAGFDIETEGTPVDGLTETTYGLEGLTTDAEYDFYVRTDCGTDGFSEWTGPYSFSVGYCSSVPSSNDNSGITNITMGNVSFPVSDVTYYNYTDAVANIAAETTVPSSVTFATSYAYNANIWIDLNDDGVFDNDSELVFQGESTSSNPSTLDTSFPLGEDAILGQHKMRIGTADSGQATPNPCYSGSYGVTVDLMVNVTPPPSCIAPTGLTVDNITSESADLSWTSDGDNFVISWGEGAFDAENGTIINGFENGGTLSGLSSNADYQFYVRTDCSGGDLSDWAGPYGFTTACAAVSDFDENFDGVTTPSLPDCWSYVIDGGASSFATVGTSTTNYSAPNSVSLYNSSSAASSNIILISPELTNLSDGTHWLRFYARNSTATQDIEVGTISNLNDGSTFTPLETVDLNTTFSEYTVSFAGYTGTDIHIAIRRLSTSTYSYVYLDNMVYEEAPSCLTPTGVTLGEIDGHTAEFSWSAIDNAEGYNWFVFANDADPESATPVASGNTTDASITVMDLDPETAYDFYVQTNCGTEDGTSELSSKIDFTTTVSCPAPINLSHTQLSMTSAELSWESSGNTFELKWGEAGFDMETEGTLVDDLTETSYTLEGLTTDADYEFYVRSNCGSEDGVSVWAGPYGFSVGYCIPTGSANNTDEIRNFTLNNLNNDSDPSEGTNGYSNYSGSVDPAQLQAGSSYEASLTSGSGGGNHGAAIWIDYDENGTFDASEMVAFLPNSIPGSGTAVFPSFTVPFSVSSGTYRLRVQYHYNKSGDTLNPCVATTQYSETEDYAVEVSAPVTWTGSEWINGSPGEDVSVLINGGLSIENDAPALEVNNLFISENGSVTVESGNSLTVNGKITNDNSAASFVVENGGNLIQTNNDANSGAITVKSESQPMIRLDYTMWSSPVVGQNLFEFSPETVNGVNYEGSTCRIYVYDGTNGYVNTGFDENTTMNGGVGYLFRSPNNFDASVPEVYEGVFTGTPFNGDLSVATVAGNYTSIGNPYPSNIDADALLAVNGPDLNTLYLWVNTPLVEGEYTGTNYATYTNAGGTANTPGGDEPSGIIAVGQGFIVKTDGTTVNLNNPMRTSQATDFFKTTDIERHRFWLNLFDGNNIGLNQILIAYMEGATSGFDSQIDGNMFGYEGSAIYSLIDEKAFTIQGRAVPFVDTDVVPLGFKATEAGTFTISLANFDGLFAEGQIIYLKDKKLGILHDLTTSEYKFDSYAGEFKNRFEIVYKDDETMGVDDLTANGVLIYKNQDFIEISSKLSPIESVEIYDLQGRRLFTESEIGTSAFQINSKQFGTQVLIVKVKTDEGSLTTKKMVNR